MGCFAASLVGLPVLGVLLFFAFYGDCFDNEQCHRGEGLRVLVVILLTLAVAVPVGMITRKLVNEWARGRNRRPLSTHSCHEAKRTLSRGFRIVRGAPATGQRFLFHSGDYSALSAALEGPPSRTLGRERRTVWVADGPQVMRTQNPIRDEVIIATAIAVDGNRIFGPPAQEGDRYGVILETQYLIPRDLCDTLRVDYKR